MSAKEAIEKYLRATGHASFSLKAALVDMDGVLYDSMRLHTAAWLRMATEIGIEATRDEFYLYEGMTGEATINVLFNRAFGRDCTHQEAEELYRRKSGYFVELGAPAMMPGALSMHTTLRDNGIKRVLVTGSAQGSVLERLSGDYPGIFPDGCRVTAHDVKRGKPHPEPYLKGMEIAACAPSECMVIENAPLGVKAGKAAGALVVGVTTGPIPAQEMWAAGADMVFPTMPAFAQALPQMIDELKNHGA